jgi:uncharacterized membrane protein
MPIAATLAGTALMLAARRPALGALAGAAGVGVLSRHGASRRDGPYAIEVGRTVRIDAPVEDVFAFWRDYRNFPRFMRNVREVHEEGEGRSRWIVAGPGGMPVEWTAEITRLKPDRLIAWRTVPGSSVEHEGRVQFRPGYRGGTRLDVRLTYRPPAGVLGHAVAKLFGADPQSEIASDLERMKTLIESGARHRGARRTGGREEQAGSAQYV